MYGRLARTFAAEAASRVISCPDRHKPDLLHRVATHSAAGDKLGLEARQKLFDGGKSPRQQGVHVPSLRYRLAAQSKRWQDLSLEDRDLIEVVRDGGGSQQAGDAGADHHRVVCVIHHGVSIRRTRPAFVGEIPYFEDKWRTAYAAA
jgi:hypothetical protein